MELWAKWAIAGAILFLIVLPYMRGICQAWQDDKRVGLVLTFRSKDNLGPNYAGGDNPWGGCLVVGDEWHITPETGEIIRAAVERYRARALAPPRDGELFHLVEGELVKL